MLGVLAFVPKLKLLLAEVLDAGAARSLPVSGLAPGTSLRQMERGRIFLSVARAFLQGFLGVWGVLAFVPELQSCLIGVLCTGVARSLLSSGPPALPPALVLLLAPTSRSPAELSELSLPGAPGAACVLSIGWGTSCLASCSFGAVLSDQGLLPCANSPWIWWETRGREAAFRTNRCCMRAHAQKEKSRIPRKKGSRLAGKKAKKRDTKKTAHARCELLCISTEQLGCPGSAPTPGWLLIVRVGKKVKSEEQGRGENEQVATGALTGTRRFRFSGNSGFWAMRLSSRPLHCCCAEKAPPGPRVCPCDAARVPADVRGYLVWLTTCLSTAELVAGGHKNGHC